MNNDDPIMKAAIAQFPKVFGLPASRRGDDDPVDGGGVVMRLVRCVPMRRGEPTSFEAFCIWGGLGLAGTMPGLHDEFESCR